MCAQLAARQDGHSEAVLAAGAAAGLRMCQCSLDFPAGVSLEFILKHSAEGCRVPESWGFCADTKAVSAPVGPLQEHSASDHANPSNEGLQTPAVAEAVVLHLKTFPLKATL